ncbi:hypothetical protein K3X13_06360 [Aliiroseovarius crassostreae]|uniref:hypothetical protein n=1 Tax=Aliiroseovarius crassostreae TaxID=154981 RepID=UPI00220E72C0|nr:hypothetical protein [Aliiroseovarius crassostreae]UWP93441.1 hypothetical protein K3X13_06360 [Aliiroseovarius crassostreae]
MAGLEIELAQARSWHGVSRFRVSLGEYRCVALAGFMAELSINDSGSGIIFNDPVSSLNPVEPTLDDIDREFDALQSWFNALAQRQKSIQVG